MQGMGLEGDSGLYSLCVDFVQVKNIGSGVALLYLMKRWLIICLFVILFPSYYALIVNSSQGNSLEYA